MVNLAFLETHGCAQYRRAQTDGVLHLKVDSACEVDDLHDLSLDVGLALKFQHG